MHRLQDAGRDPREATRLTQTVPAAIAEVIRGAGNPANYCGRFAPSPSGPLHFGSLVTALASYLQARKSGGRWLVRMEDLDTPRNQPGAAATIQQQLKHLGLNPDAAIVTQSSRLPIYRDVLENLQARALTFACGCSRQEIGNDIYPGTCRPGLPAGKLTRTLRLRAASDRVSFEDGLQGQYGQHIAEEVGDFVIRRADNIIAYHLAVVVDDACQQVTEVVRGADLLDSTPRQIYLQRLLGVPTPHYVHLPVAVDADGCKLSKHNGASALGEERPSMALWQALVFLGQEPDCELGNAGVPELIAWAVKHWSLAKVPRVRKIALPLQPQ